MKYRIAHIGAFDFENFGDLLFTDVLENKLGQRIDIEEIVYFAPKACKMPGKDRIVHSVTELEDMAAKMHFDAIIVGGGDLVHMLKTRTHMPHIAKEWVEYEVIYIWTILSLVAQKCHIPLIWNAPGVPMFFEETEKRVVSLLCEGIDYISVRDYLSKEVLSCAVDKNRINVVPDTVLCIRDIISEDELATIFDQLPLDIQSKKYIFFQGNTTFSDEDIQRCADVLFRLKQMTGYQIVLQPIGYALGDKEVLDRIKNIYPNEFLSISKRLTQYEILALIAHSALYIGSSLHGCITSNSYGIKNIVYNIDHFRKTDGFVELIDREDTRVYHSADIMSAYDCLREVNKKEMDRYIAVIEEHFNHMAEVIKSGVKKDNPCMVQDIAEYIYASSSKIDRLQEETRKLSSECRRIKEENTELQGFKEAYVEVMNSFSWKITRPVRKTIDMIKQSRRK